MELKKYQKRVLGDLRDYLAELSGGKTLSQSYRDFWAMRQVEVGRSEIPGYQNILEGVPNVCFKVPTGGGKTVLAAAAVKPIFDALPPTKTKAVVWLVPSDAILTQTLAALKNPAHPYRQQLNLDFAGRIEVYSKEELLSGQNFSPAAITEQVSVMVLSFDSFRTTKKEGRKAYQANGQLSAFHTALGDPEHPIENADNTALAQVINQLNPVVVVDEAHHARSTLSLEMLKTFNPAFVLDLTATPSKKSNVISYVSALELKNELMVKLPVIVYNRSSRTDVITDAIDLRHALEEAAVEAEKADGEYIRPIALLQAQPKVGVDAETFEKLREKLIGAGIPEDQIAIKTSGIDELKGIDLESRQCPIRFIITVNALKEGWDCPFAYVLASLANKTSSVDVEQILGRVLRQPYTRQHGNSLLNMSYVLTSSLNFQQTLDKIVVGLNAAGLSAREYRIAGVEPVASEDHDSDPKGEQQRFEFEALPLATRETEVDSFDDLDGEAVAVDLKNREAQRNESCATASTTLAGMIDAAEQQAEEYKATTSGDESNESNSDVPDDLKDVVPMYSMVEQFLGDAAKLKIPQFFTELPVLSLFSDGESDWDLLQPEHLNKGFTLKGRDTTVDLTHAGEQMIRVDVDTQSTDRPRAFSMSNTDQDFIRQHFHSLAPAARIKACTDIVFDKLNKNDAIGSADLRDYVQRIVEGLDKSQLSVLETSPYAVAQKVNDKVQGFLGDYRFEKFEEGIKVGQITALPNYELPAKITPINATALVGKSLYEAEDKMNSLEQKLALAMSSMDSVVWWHRVIERRGFCLNGALNHYPDFLVYTTRGNIIAVETKGGHLKNDDSRLKLKLGSTWSSAAGPKFHYFMIFEDGVNPLDGAETETSFMNLLAQL